MVTLRKGKKNYVQKMNSIVFFMLQCFAERSWELINNFASTSKRLYEISRWSDYVSNTLLKSFFLKKKIGFLYYSENFNFVYFKKISLQYKLDYFKKFVERS